MTPNPAAVDLAPVAAIAVIALVLAALPLAWLARRHRRADPVSRLKALTVLTLFLSVDLVLLGAFTRLSDSGLGCPDWPGCYGHASPIGATTQIASAEAAMPTGAVTRSKAWIEMAHRYAAAAIGVLSIALALLAWRESRRGRVAASPTWAYATVVWVIAQGAFGALTVAMRLHPAIVTLHLLGGMALLALLAAQVEVYAPRALHAAQAEPYASQVLDRAGSRLRLLVGIVVVLAVLQIALGGWVSSNYAVLACSDFPTCQGSWWPPADFAAAFEIDRPLGQTGEGTMLAFAALTAIHLAHRIGALVLVAGVVVLAVVLRATGGVPARRFATALLAISAWQVASGLGNVLLGWPLAAALAHTAGAAALVIVLTTLSMRVAAAARQVRRSNRPSEATAAVSRDLGSGKPRMPPSLDAGAREAQAAS